MKNKYRDIFAALFVIALAVFIQYFSKDIMVSSFTNLGANFFPRLISIILGLLGIVLIIFSIIEFKKDSLTKSAEIDEKDNKSSDSLKGSIIPIISRNSDWISIILIMAYAYSMPYVGFIISSIVYLFFQMIVLSVKSNRKILSFGVIAIIAPIVIYYIFTSVFSLMLPQGILG